MSVSTRLYARAAVLSLALLCASLLRAGAEQPLLAPDGIAIRGYDVVAYFTQGHPVRGTPMHRQVWQDATWLFFSEENRAAFAADPERYAPRYGGYCAGAMIMGALVPADPESFVIVDGKLYLNSDKASAVEFGQTATTSVAAADKNWLALGKTN